MRALAVQLGLPGSEIETAQVIGLLHDVGRFDQYDRFRTFNDRHSLDHAAHSVTVIEKQAVLADYTTTQQRRIACAIAHHNKAALPASLQDGVRFWCQLIRDADKLDIYRVALGQQRALARNQSSIDLYHDFPDEPKVSDRVYGCILAGGIADVNDLVYLNDLKLMQMAWVFDLNFTPSFHMVRRRQYLEGIYASMPRDHRVQEAYRCVRAYLAKRLEKP
jgi:hypothetical protein